MNRQQRRKLMKRLKQKDTYKILNLENTFNSFAEGTKVKIIPEKCIKNNIKRNKFIEKNSDKIMTVCYDEKFKNNPHVYSLLEDENNPKWLWNHSELEKVKDLDTINC